METGYAIEAVDKMPRNRKRSSWFSRWLHGKMKAAWSAEQEEHMNLVGAQPIRGTSLDANGMNFKVYKANGGYIIETNMYDRKIDRHNNGLHIITGDKDLGQELAKIITMECLRA